MSITLTCLPQESYQINLVHENPQCPGCFLAAWLLASSLCQVHVKLASLRATSSGFITYTVCPQPSLLVFACPFSLFFPSFMMQISPQTKHHLFLFCSQGSALSLCRFTLLAIEGSFYDSTKTQLSNLKICTKKGTHSY